MDNKPLPEISIAAKPYWEACARGQLLLQRCLSCGFCIHYPRQWCPSCLGTGLEWIRSSGRGMVHTFTVIHASGFESYARELPYILAVIDLEEGPRIMTNLVRCDPDRVRVAMPVRVCFEKRSEEACVPQFMPADES